MLKKSFFVFFSFFILCQIMWGSNITFKSGTSNVSFTGQNKIVELGGGAEISTGDIDIKAEYISIKGDDFGQIFCKDKVEIKDNTHNISIYSTSLDFDRQKEQITIDGWVEMQDLGNLIAASAAWMEFDMKNGLLNLQIRAKILKDTSKGVMICRADSISLDRSANKLTLVGGASIEWNGDRYNADSIQVDLKTEAVKLIGKIKGNVNG